MAKSSRFGEHVVLAAIAVVATLAFLLLFSSPDIIWRLSMATAYAGLLYLAAALSIGAINVLRRAPNPLSINLRRDIGIVAGILALAHTIVGLLVHLKRRPIPSIAHIGLATHGRSIQLNLMVQIVVAALFSQLPDCVLGIRKVPPEHLAVRTITIILDPVAREVSEVVRVSDGNPPRS
jgi:hypothetical protein